MQIQSNDVDVAASDSPRNWPGSSRWQFGPWRYAGVSLSPS